MFPCASLYSDLGSAKICTCISSGVDSIDSYVIKLAKVEILPVITHIVNLSLKYSSFPKLWKVAKVIPLHKKGDTFIPKNLRPVALLPIVSKILERAIFVQVASDGPFALRKVEAGLYGVLKSEFQTHEVGIVPNF